MQIVRQASFAATPWKNGGGITHEAFRVPAGGQEFRWRLSVARIEASGPFSNFAGYERTLVLLRGAGIRLGFGDGAAVSLQHRGGIAQFDGALPVECRLLNGPCVDLNLMVAHTMPPADVTVESLRKPRQLSASAGAGSVLIFGIDGELAVHPASGSPVRLEPWDLAILPAHEPCTVHPASGSGSSSLVFFAALNDNLA